MIAARSSPNRIGLAGPPWRRLIALLAAAGDETLEAHITDWGEMLTRFRALLRRIRASQRRRAQLSGDPLLPPDGERARARATLDYYNRVGDPASW